MNKNIEEYCKYMEKSALKKQANPIYGLYLAFAGGGKFTGDVIATGLALAALTGAGIGAFTSKLTSPGKQDFKNVQRKFIKEKLSDEVAEVTRELQFDKMRQEQLKEPKPKSIHL